MSNLFSSIKLRCALPLLLIAGFGQVATAQSEKSSAIPDNETSRYIKEYNQRAGVNGHAYEFLPIYDTPSPKGYKPFYISHYGRHGSRSTGAKEYFRIKGILEPAHADGQLTPQGEMLLAATLKAIECQAGMSGHLTPRGRREHAAIAERMYNRYPVVFKDGSKKIFAASSYIPRCLISMNSFTNRLMSLQPDLQIDLETGENYMDYIGRGEPDEVQELAEPILDSLDRMVSLDSMAIIPVLFKDPANARKYVKKVARLEYDIFSLARYTQAFDIEDNLYDLLPANDVYQLSEQRNMHIYLQQANSLLLGDKRMPNAAPLAKDIIDRANEVIAGEPRVADLRFGHDWPLMALMAYLGLEGASERLGIDEVKGHWFAGRYIPFAGNLQLVFYRNAKNDVLVKFLVNEKESRIPALTPVQGPYYRWSDYVRLITERK